MKRGFLLFLFVMLLSQLGFAHDFMVDGICYNIISDEYRLCEVTYFKKQTGAIERNFYKDVVFVPETVDFGGNTYFVSAISACAFSDNDELLSVVMPNTIRVIGNSAFSGCRQMKSITIPKSVEHIESGAFCALESLSYLSVDEDNPVYDSRCGCNAIIESATNTLLYGCRTTEIPHGVEVIAMNAFWIVCNTEPFALDIPASVKVIDCCAFQTCDWLVGVTLHDGLEKIGDGAFRHTSIERITIPATVTEVVPSAFAATKRLKSIKVKRGNKVYDSRGGCNAIIESATDRLVQACATTKIPEGAKVIGRNAFKGVEKGSVDIPSSVVELENGAFFGCGLRGTLVIPGSVKSIGKYAFTACRGIDSLVVEEGCERIAASAFSLCSGLRHAKLPSTLKEFGAGSEYVLVFDGCNLLERIELPNENPTYYCNGDVIIEKSTLAVVAGCGLGHCQINKALGEYRPKKIAKGAFWGMQYLTALWLPGTIEEIEEGAFDDCPAIEFIYCANEIPPLLDKNFGLVNSSWHLPVQERAVLIVPEGSLEAYRNTPGWKEFKHITTHQ